MCALILGVSGADRRVTERERDNDDWTTHVVSHINALVWCVLYDCPRRKALCSVHFADDETMA